MSVHYAFKLSEETKAKVREFSKNTQDYQKYSNGVARVLATTLSRRVKGIIVRQEFTPLKISEEWRDQKEREGLDERTLIATKDYLRSIKAKKVAPAVWGVEADALKTDVLEEGNPVHRTPTPRPHWRLAFEQVTEESPGIVEDFVRKVMGGV